ncbi:WD40 containing domain protein [Mycena kentingensis (nom. inval.)]|nr:WD40 containing domain protein [Mycena kentingensis (nom. inval.)]
MDITPYTSGYRHPAQEAARGRGQAEGAGAPAGAGPSQMFQNASNVGIEDAHFTTEEGYRFQQWTPAQTKDFSAPRHDNIRWNNQTTFLHGFTLTLGEGLWAKLFGTVGISQISHGPPPLSNQPGSVPFGSPGSCYLSILSWLFGRRDYGGGNADAEEGTIVAEFGSTEIPHPAQILRRGILKTEPGVRVVLVHDDAWSDVLGSLKERNIQTSAELASWIHEKCDVSYEGLGEVISIGSRRPTTEHSPRSNELKKCTRCHAPILATDPDRKLCGVCAQTEQSPREETSDRTPTRPSFLPATNPGNLYSYSSRSAAVYHRSVTDMQPEGLSLSTQRNTMEAYGGAAPASNLGQRLALACAAIHSSRRISWACPDGTADRSVGGDFCGAFERRGPPERDLSELRAALPEPVGKRRGERWKVMLCLQSIRAENRTQA